MGDKPTDTTAPRSHWFGAWSLNFGWMGVWGWWRLRFVWYDPREREHWKASARFLPDIWQIEFGPIGFVYVRSDDY